jgi:TonB family protein
VPARLEFVVVFDVDPQGVVVPGSVILQKSSGHTAVDRKVRSAILNWKFLPKPQAETETGVFTLVVERSDIR